MRDITIQRATVLPEPELAGLIDESEAEGLDFVRRLRDDWRSRSNRFDQPGEALCVAWAQDQLVGVCGLNRDVYAARHDFTLLRLRTDDPSAARFYERQGCGSEALKG